MKGEYTMGKIAFEKAREFMYRNVRTLDISKDLERYKRTMELLLI